MAPGPTPIEEGQQLTCCSGTAGQRRNGDSDGLALLGWQRQGSERVAQGLQIAAKPGEAFPIRQDPQLPQHLGILDQALGLACHAAELTSCRRRVP